MTSIQHLRDFIRNRLAAAAEDIFSAFERTIVQYEEKLEHQCRLQETSWNPVVQRHGTDLPQQHACNQEEFLAAQQLCNQERSSSPEPENPESPQVKEEHEELCSSQKGEPPVLKEETDTDMATLTQGESDRSDPEPDGDELLSNCSDTVVSVDSKSREILQVINKCIQDKVEIDHQCRVLDHTWNPVVKLYRTGLPQQNVCKQEEVLANEERSSSPEQENPESPQVKEEQEELCSSQEGEQLGEKQVTDMARPCLGPPAPVEPSTAHFNVSAGLKTITFTGEKLYLCNTCGKLFTTMYSFKRHNTIHTGEKPFLCNTCGRGFRQKYPLTVHMRTHTGELPYICNTCGKGFKEKVRLRMHMPVHTGERPHVCNTCGRNFKDKGTLRGHMKIHTKELVHVCSTCGGRFQDGKALKKHMKSHTGEKPYVCNVCGKRSRDMAALKRHRKIHIGQWPNLCNTCGKRYKKITTLKLHMQKIHMMQS